MYREHTKVIQIGERKIGGGNPILIQSMTNTKTEDVAATVAQILALEAAGCEIIRCTVPTMEAAKALAEIKKQIHIPLVADIHFDYKMAIAAMENGADKIRINPGNIGSADRVKAVVDAAKERKIPIRVGVNSGSLEKNLVEKYGGVTAEGIVESALDKVHMIEDLGYDNLVVSIKSSDVMMCVKAHELLADKTVYPLHVGITESGTVQSGNIKSAVGLGIILNQGIGDTIRVSLTGNPVEEIKSAKLILRTLGLRKGGIEVVSCPTCGRTQIDLIGLATRVETLEKNLVEKYGGVTAEGIVESALDKVHMIEDLGYDNLVVSIKSSDVMMCVKAHELLADKTVYPLHVGITESGTVQSGNIKSAVGLGIILNQGIGDTIRVSLTGNPVEEIKSAKLILRTLGLRKGGIEVVSCPTCGRTQIDLIGLATRVEKLVEDYPLDIKVAVMGCVVNGPGEAKEADLGVAGGIGEGLLIKKGEIIRKVPEEQLLAALKEELDNWS